VTLADIIPFSKLNGAKQLDLRFIGFPSSLQHASYPIHDLTEQRLAAGFHLDGSLTREWVAPKRTELVLVPDPNTAHMDPFASIPTLAMFSDVMTGIVPEHSKYDQRWFSKKAEIFLNGTGIADVAYFCTQAEFFIFDSVTYQQSEDAAFYYLQGQTRPAKTGTDPEGTDLAPKYKKIAMSVAPEDHHRLLRDRMVQTMIRCGLDLSSHFCQLVRHNQGVIGFRHRPLTNAADDFVLAKYIVKTVAQRSNKTATFMPKPLFADHSNCMHTHQSLWKAGNPLFAGDGYAGLSQTALYYIGGLLKHAKALSAIVAPTTNSYKRLLAGTEAPINISYSRRNISTAVRIPMFRYAHQTKRVEYRPPDPLCSPHLAFSAMLMAGIDGIINRIDPGPPLDKDIYDLSPDEMTRVPQLPASLEEALDSLMKDRAFLLRADVFDEGFLEAYVSHKRIYEVDALRSRPHPYEFTLYYDS
jgi:glutamine synthetase